MPTRWPSWDEVIARYGLRLKPQGGQLRGPCPLHGGSNATSFVITLGKGFYCHSCGRGGGVVAFLEFMGDSCLPDQDAVRPWHEALGRSEPLHLDLERLAQGRTRALAGLLAVPQIRPLDPRHPYLGTRGVHPETARRFACGYLWGQGAFGGRIVFPIRTPDGRLVGHIGRAVLPDTEPRYRFQKGLRKGLLLLNEHAVSHSSPLVVVEGPFDALAVSQAGVINVVALLGCQASGHQLAALAGYTTVLILLDGDEPGQEGTARIVAALGSRAVAVRLAGDPGSTGTSTLLAALTAAGAVRTTTPE